MPPAVTKTRTIHQEGLDLSSALSGYYVKNFIPPREVIQILNEAGVRFMLVGAHGLSGWMNEPRATQDVDVLVGYRQHQKATRALLAVHPHLQVDDQEVVVRLSDPETGRVIIDIMKANQPLMRVGLKHTQAVEEKGISYRVPSLEMALALKFAAMVSVVRADEKKYRDASDFIEMVKKNPDIDLETLAELGELVYPDGGKAIVENVECVRTGKKLVL
jgi:hypothetical protein